MTGRIERLAARYRSNDITPFAHIRNCIRRIAELEDPDSGFVAISPGAIEEAERATRDLQSRHDRGSLHGIPFAVTDVIDVAGQRTGCGSRVPTNQPAMRDASVVASLRQAGAILVGKLSTFEYAVGSPGPDSLWPHTNNPYDRHHIAGPSGGGAAVSLELIEFALALDSGGAARSSAALTGTFGLKPTRHLLALDGFEPVAATLDHCGLIAGHAADLRELITLLSPTDGRSGARDTLQDQIRIGVLGGIFEGGRNHIEPFIRSTIGDPRLKVEEVTLPYDEDLQDVAQLISAVEMYQTHRGRLASLAKDYASNTRHRLIFGAFFEQADYELALSLAKRFEAHFADEILNQFDILLAPAAPGVAPISGLSTYGVSGRSGVHTVPFNLLGNPAVTLPCATSGGLPVAAQLIGRHGHDLALLETADYLDRHHSKIGGRKS